MTSIITDNNSNTRIKKLSPLLINQLAAGEVVTRPSAVVKELLENAIDAGATDIEVRITQGGMGMIEVVDNGVGIYPDDMVMAITRHATSKVADIANLHGISTLGFRGEALAATAAVSRLTLTSSHDNSGIGRQLQVAGVLADVPKLVPVVRNQGTTVTVKDLYFNVPARRGNLKSIGTEFAHIEAIVREVALARADVTLSLYHDQKKRLTLSATSISSTVGNISGSNENHLPLLRLEQALGLPLGDSAIEVKVDLSSLLHDSNTSADDAHQQAAISGWLWPIVANHNHTNQVSHTSLPKLLYVNGRLVKEALISNQLRQLATSAQLDGIGYALYFELPTHWLNINVHPTKQRIKISPLNNVMAHLTHFIGHKLKSVNTSIDNHTNIAQALNSSASLKQQSNQYASYKDDSYKKDASSRQQVHAPQSQYQLSEKNQLSEKSLDINTNTLISNHCDNDSAELRVSFSNSRVSLPHCLDVISSLPNNYQATSTSKIDSDNISLPWLLFYSQGQCLLINQQGWQGIWQAVFENKPDAPLLNEDQSSEQDTIPLSASILNQKINSYARQMSVQQLAAFKTILQQALSRNAHSIINTEQLLKVMLSSASS